MIQHEDIYVIIDDQFIVGENDEWLLGRSTDLKELWVNVLEKAYAKLFGGYGNIVSGKVSYSLSHLTGGYPEELDLVPLRKSPNTLWSKMKNYYDKGYKLGAGTPSNVKGDSAVSEEGIV